MTAIFLFVAFSGIVAKAQQVIERQHEQLIEQEGLGVVGEMARDQAIDVGARRLERDEQCAVACEAAPELLQALATVLLYVGELTIGVKVVAVTPSQHNWSVKLKLGSGCSWM